MKVRRYATSCVPWPNTAGGYVRYSSYERLLTQNAKQAAEIAALRRTNEILVRWKGEIDSRRFVLRLPFPVDYDNSPMYAVQSLIDAALAAREAE